MADERVPVTVIGLGSLGSVLTRAFLEHGHPTIVWNRTAGKAADLVGRGARDTGTVTEAVAATPVVVVCVSDYEAVREVLGQAGEALRGLTVVNLTSGTPEQARVMGAWAADRGAGYLDGAAMSGTRLVGQPEALFVYGGAGRAFATHQAALASLGRAVHVGEDPGLASLYDTALFGMAWGALAGFYHALALVGAEGVDPAAFAAVATGHMPFVTGLMTDHAGQVGAGRYPDDDGSVAVHAAAMAHLIDTSRASGVATGLPALIKGLLEQATASGHGDHGIASVAEALRKPAEAA